MLMLRISVMFEQALMCHNAASSPAYAVLAASSPAHAALCGQTFSKAICQT